MILIFITMLIGTSLFNMDFIKLSFLGISVFDGIALWTFITYINFFLHDRLTIKYNRVELKSLLYFIIYAVFVVILSYMGFFKLLYGKYTLFDTVYIPRQAYYIYFLPLIFVSVEDSFSYKVLSNIMHYGKTYYILLWACFVIIHRDFALNVCITFVLGFLILISFDLKYVFDDLLFLVFILSPIGVGGESTQFIIRFLLLIFVVLKSFDKVFSFIFYALLLIIFMSFVIGFCDLDNFNLEPNTLWRAKYWADEVRTLIRTTGIGVGYGTSYASKEFVGDAIMGPFAATSDFSVMDRLFVVGCHNSIVSITYRTGVVGLFLLINFLTDIYKQILTSINKVSCYLYSSALIIILFNVGFESPSYLFIFMAAVIFSMISPEVLNNGNE